MHWYLLGAALVSVVVLVLWYTWARLLAGGVSYIARRNNVHLEVGSLTIKTALQVLLRFPKGPLGEVRFRRLHLGCHYDDDRQGHANALQRFASIISSFRIIIKFVGLRVQLKTRCLDVESHATIEDERAEGMNEGKPHVSTQMVRQGQVPLLLIHMLSFFDVYIEGLDVESLDGVSLLQSKEIKIGLGSKLQRIDLDGIFVKPVLPNSPSRFARALLHVDSASINATGSIHALLKGGPRKGRQVKVQLGNTCINWDMESYKLLKRGTLLLKQRATRNAESEDARYGRHMDVETIISRFLDREQNPVAIEVGMKKIQILDASQLQRYSCLEINSLDVELHAHPRQRESGKIESAVSWDRVSIFCGSSVESASIEFQSSASRSNFVLLDSPANTSSHVYHIQLTTDIQALHTRCWYRNLGPCVSLLRSFKRKTSTENEILPVSARSPLPVEADIKLSLGNGSSLQFVDANGDCQLHNSVECVSLTLHYFQGMNGPEEDNKDTLSKVPAEFWAKFDADNIAMAIMLVDEKSQERELGQILSAKSMRIRVTRDVHMVPLTELYSSGVHAVFPHYQLKHFKYMAESFSETAKRFNGHGEQKRKTKAINAGGSHGILRNFRCSFADVSLACINEQIIDKEISSINRQVAVHCAIGVRVLSVDVEVKENSLFDYSSTSARLLYYHGKSVKYFFLDFDDMEQWVRSVLLDIDEFSLKGNKESKDVSMGKVSLIFDIDAALCALDLIHKLKLNDSNLLIRSKSSKKMDDMPITSDHAKNSEASMVKLRILRCHLSVPLSADREISLIVDNLEGKTASEGRILTWELQMSTTTILMRSSRIFELKSLYISRECEQEDSSVLVRTLFEVEVLSFIVPHNRDPGPTLKYAMLFSRAVKMVFSQMLDIQVQRNDHPGPPEIIPEHHQIIVRIKNGVFAFEHHPFESWYARTALARKQATLQQYVWTEACSAFFNEEHQMASPLHTGVRTSSMTEDRKRSLTHATSQSSHDFEKGCSAGDPSWSALMKEIGNTYIKCVQNLVETNKTLCSDVLRVEVKGLDILCDINKDRADDAVSKEKALAFVRSVDEYSEGVSFKSCTLINTDAKLQNLALRFGGSNKEMFSGESIQMTGPFVLAKQAGGMVPVQERAIHLGLHHIVLLQLPERGTQPPFKFYSDMKINLGSASIVFSPGLDAALALVGPCAKRLVVRDPDAPASKNASIPWWDDLRYFWRGNVLLHAQTLSARLTPGKEAFVSPNQERLEAMARDLSFNMLPGKYAIKSSHLRVLVLRNAPLESGQSLLAYPLCDLRPFKSEMTLVWKLPDDRNPNDHHLHLKDSRETQKPVEVSKKFQALSMDMNIHVNLIHESEDWPKLFVGGENMMFIRDFIRYWKLPQYIRTQVRKGTYFVRKPRSQAKKKSIPMLLCNVSLSVKSEKLEAIHFTPGPEEPGAGLSVVIDSGFLEMRWRCNEELPLFLNLPPHARALEGPEPPRKTTMRHLQVALEKVVVQDSIREAHTEESKSSLSIPKNVDDGNELLKEIFIAKQSSAEFFSPPWLAENVRIYRILDDGIAAEQDPFGTRPTVPLKVLVEDCKFLTDLQMRDTIWATVENLIAAFSRRVETSFSCTPNAGTSVDRRFTPSVKSPFSDADPEMKLRPPSQSSELSVTAENNELLSLLLKQKDEAGVVPDAPSNLPSPQHTMDLEHLEEEPPVEDSIGEKPMSCKLDDLQSDLKYEVEVSNLQLVMQRDSSSGSGLGRLLLAARKGLLQGLVGDHGALKLNITTLILEDVQGYVSLSSVDPHAQIRWLDISESKEFVAPSVEDISAAWRRIFNPITIELRHSKSKGQKVLTRRGSLTPVLSSSMAPGRGPGEELILKVPDIAAVLDGREFDVLIDVVSFLITTGPTVETCNSRKMLLLESENEMIEDARCMFVLLHRQLSTIHSELNELQACLSDAQQHGLWSLNEEVPNSGATHVHIRSQRLETPSDSGKMPSTELREFLSSLVKKKTKPIKVEDYIELCAPILYRWTLEQRLAAIESYVKGKEALQLQKHKFRLQVQAAARGASRMLIQLNRVVWQLCDMNRTPFVQASIKKVVFDRRRNKDHSGSAKFMLHRLDILDATGVLPEGPATPAGVILTIWNPEESYEREPVLRVISTLGVPTPTHDIYEHLDATLHPLSLHVTEQIATRCWEYFFPKEDVKSRQEAFAHSVSAKRKKLSNENVIEQSPKRALSATSKGSRSGWDDMGEPSPPGSVIADGSDHGASRYQTPRSARKKSSPSMKKRKNSLPRKRTQFVYVKLNRAHMRITYQGYPIGIKDRVLVINSYACENLEGTWRDLLSNVKQKAILSAMISGLGLQGRKIKELMEGATPAGPIKQDEEAKSGHKGLFAKIGMLGKAKKEAANYRMGEKDILEMQKRRALFGDTLSPSMSHAGPSASSREGSPERRNAAGSSVVEPAYIYDIPLELSPTKIGSPMPILDLEKPLPPEDDSSDSGSESELALPADPMPQFSSPLRHGLRISDDHRPEFKSQDPQHTFSSAYLTVDATKPPELRKIDKSTDPHASGPRWMK